MASLQNKKGLCAYQQQQELLLQPLPQHVLAPGVNCTVCAPSWQVEPTLLVNLRAVVTAGL